MYSHTKCTGAGPSLGTFGQSRLAQAKKESINLLCSLPALPGNHGRQLQSLPCNAMLEGHKKYVPQSQPQVPTPWEEAPGC